MTHPIRLSRDGVIDCALVLVLAMVGAIFYAPAPAEAHVASFHYHYPSVRYTVFEQFGVTATQTYVRGKVAQDHQPSIGNPLIISSQCYSSDFPSWTVHGCTPLARKYGTGASGYAKISIVGDYTHSSGVDYVQYSYYKKRANEGDTFYCGLTYGSLPWFWDDHCYAYLDGVQVGDY